MTFLQQPHPMVGADRRGAVDQPDSPGQPSLDQPEAHSIVQPALGPIPLFARLVRATRAGDDSHADELREQLSGIGWTIKRRSENKASVAEESRDLVARAELTDSSGSTSATQRTKRSETKPKIPLDQRLTWDLNDLESLTGLSRRHFERLRKVGRLPAPDAKCGRRVLWFPATIRAWLANGGTA
jgi:hypothetical protein